MQAKNYKGVVLNSSNIERLANYIHNHKSIIHNESKDDMRCKMEDEYLQILDYGKYSFNNWMQWKLGKPSQNLN